MTCRVRQMLCLVVVLHSGVSAASSAAHPRLSRPSALVIPDTDAETAFVANKA